MNKKFVIPALLLKYKYVGIPVLFVIAGILIFFQLIVPGIATVNSLNHKISQENKKLDDYKSSVVVLKSASETQLVEQMDLVTKALPASKDIQGIYLALISSSARANILLRGFSVKVGNVFQKDTGKKDTVNGVPFVSVNVLVSRADLNSLYAFSKALSSQSPLNTSIKASLASGEGSLDINFYFKPYNPDIIKSNLVKPVSKDELAVLQKLLNQSLPQ